MELPKKERSFILDHIGESTGFKYDGTFTVKALLSIRDKRSIEVEKSTLKADLVNPTEELITMAHVLANLRVRIITGPSWWMQSAGGLNLEDDEVMYVLYNKVIEQEKSWLKEVRDQVKESSEGNS